MHSMVCPRQPAIMIYRYRGLRQMNIHLSKALVYHNGVKGDADFRVWSWPICGQSVTNH